MCGIEHRDWSQLCALVQDYGKKTGEEAILVRWRTNSRAAAGQHNQFDVVGTTFLSGVWRENMCIIEKSLNDQQCNWPPHLQLNVYENGPELNKQDAGGDADVNHCNGEQSTESDKTDHEPLKESDGQEEIDEQEMSASDDNDLQIETHSPVINDIEDQESDTCDTLSTRENVDLETESMPRNPKRKRLLGKRDALMSMSKNRRKSKPSKILEAFQCEVCEKCFSGKSQLINHLKVHSTDGKYTCQLCPKGFSRKKNLLKHTKLHQLAREKKICNICGKEFPSIKRLNAHVRYHNKVECKICGKMVAAPCIAYHEKTHQHREPLSCETCGKTFLAIAPLRIHRKIHETGQHPYQCDVCNRSLCSFTALTNHKLTHKGEELDLSEEKHYKCETCNKRFAREINLVKHKELHLVKKECPTCGKEFKSKKRLAAHIHTHTKAECKYCHKMFPASYLATHEGVHTGQRAFTCEVCGKNFLTSSQLRIHRKIHTSDNHPYRCDLCNGEFSSRPAVVKHRMRHTGERPHKCHVCGKGFIQKLELDFHLKTHTGELPWVCEVCGKGFIRKAGFNLHMTTHSDLKPFECHICKKAFRNSRDCKKHLVTHSSEKPHQCVVCSRGFKQKYNLTAHMRTHSDRKNFSCEVCYKTFSDKRSLQKHSVMHETDIPTASSHSSEGVWTHTSNPSQRVNTSQLTPMPPPAHVSRVQSSVKEPPSFSSEQVPDHGHGNHPPHSLHYLGSAINMVHEQYAKQYYPGTMPY